MNKNHFFMWMFLSLIFNFANLNAAHAEKLPVLYSAPAFDLIDHNGAGFGSGKLKGKIWVADFLFTSCSDECPLMTNAMKTVQQQLKTEKNVEFVSLTSDPQTDTSKVLKKYVKKMKVDDYNWHFLTGDKKSLVSIAREGFKLPADDKGPSHSQKFVLIDVLGNVRGYYDSTSKQDLAKLVSDIHGLTKE